MYLARVRIVCVSQRYQKLGACVGRGVGSTKTTYRTARLSLLYYNFYLLVSKMGNQRYHVVFLENLKLCIGKVDAVLLFRSPSKKTGPL